ncbi:MAG: ATP-grasp fold amidoligase family protein [Clostridium perfringens]
MKNNIRKAITSPSKIILYLLEVHSNWFWWMSDKRFLSLKFKFRMGKKLNLKNPKTFNEKIQYLKIFDQNPEYTKLVDKYEVKKYVAEKIGEEYIIPTIGSWCNVDEIDWDILPDKFVLKSTHDSGGLVICKNKKKLNVKKAKQKLNNSLNNDYYLMHREWPYKNVYRRIIAEKYMEDRETKELRDYKFFCFNGKVKVFKIDFDRQINHRANYYDKDGNIITLGETVCPQDFEREIKLPNNLDKMEELAEKLSAGYPFLRVDFYEVNGKIYFGELTFYPATGMGKFTSDEWDYKLGEWIDISKI